MSFIGGLFSGIGSLVGSSMQADAMKQAAQMQQQEQALALAQQKQFFNTGLGYEQPFINSGNKAMTTLENAYGLNGTGAQADYMKNFKASPFFDTMVKNAAATTEAQAGHGGFTGNLTNALYNQNAGMWNQAYNNQLSGISGIANTGAGAANTIMNSATGAGNAAINGIANFSNQIGGNIAGAGSSLGSGIAGAGNALNNSLTNYQLLSMLNGSGSNMLSGGFGSNPGWTPAVMGPS